MYSAKIITDHGNLYFDYDHHFVFDISPLSGVDVTLDRVQNYANNLGERVSDQFTGGVTRTIRGVVLHYSNVQQQLFSVLTPGTTGKLVIDDSYWCNFYVKKTPTVAKDKSGRIQFSAQVFCPVPYWFVGNDKSQSFYAYIPAFSFPVNYAIPHTFGTIINDSFLKISNNSGIAIPYSVTLTAISSVTNPRIYEAYGLNKLQFDIEMDEGDYIIFDSYEGANCEVSLSGNVVDTNRYISNDSDLFYLPAGENILKVEADEGKENLSVVISYKTVTMGVELSCT